MTDFADKMKAEGFKFCDCCNYWCSDVKPVERAERVVQLCGCCRDRTNQEPANLQRV